MHDSDTHPDRYDFAVDPRFRALLLPFGVRGPSDTGVVLDADRLLVRFGHWSLGTPARNLAGARVTGPFAASKVLGPRLSLADRGLTFGTSTERGVCIRFHRPVPGLEPLGVLRHPAVTVTVRDPDALAAAVDRHAAAAPDRTPHRPGPTPQPGLIPRAAAIACYPAGLALSTARYVRCAGRAERSEAVGDPTDRPPALPDGSLDAHLTTAEEGSGPLLHRTFRVLIRGARVDAAGLVDLLCADPDRAAPSEVAAFRKRRGRPGELRVGDEYVVRMPAPWRCPVRVVARDATSFRFATLAGHIEAGQIEFRARDVDGGLEFGVEAWSRPGDGPAAVVFDRLGIGKEIQLHVWTQFCLTACRVAGGRPVGPIRVHTRRCAWPPVP